MVAPQSPADCFDAALEAARIAITYRTPVLLLSDGYLANGQEPWRIPDITSLPAIDPASRPVSPTGTASSSRSCVTPRHSRDRGPCPARRDWPTGSAGSKADRTGNISYDPDNHDTMVRLRQARSTASTFPDLVVDDPTGDADLLVIGWGSTYGPITAGVRRVRKEGKKVAQAHLRYLNPMPRNTGEVLRSYRRCWCPR